MELNGYNFKCQSKYRIIKSVKIKQWINKLIIRKDGSCCISLQFLLNLCDFSRRRQKNNLHLKTEIKSRTVFTIKNFKLVKTREKKFTIIKENRVQKKRNSSEI